MVNRSADSSTVAHRPLEIRVERRDGLAIVSLAGAVDAFTLGEFEETLEPLCDRDHAKVLVDCDDLTYVNSTSFGLLFHFHKVCEARHGLFALCSVREKIRSLLRLLGLEDVLRIYGTRAEAVEALRSGYRG